MHKIGTGSLETTKIKTDVKCCIQKFFIWGSASELEIKKASVYWSALDSPSRSEMFHLTDVISSNSFQIVYDFREPVFSRAIE